MKDYNDVVPFSFIFLQVEKCDWAINAAYTNDLPKVFQGTKFNNLYEIQFLSDKNIYG